eukprot:1139059-Pelagomonas_calceolata.AAC.1
MECNSSFVVLQLLLLSEEAASALLLLLHARLLLACPRLMGAAKGLEGVLLLFKSAGKLIGLAILRIGWSGRRPSAPLCFCSMAPLCLTLYP